LLRVALAASVAFLAALAAWLALELAWLRFEVAFADDQTAIFAEMRARAAGADAAEAARCLAYVVSYYPSGTKQRTGSRLDRIVERNRAAAVSEIIWRLKARTGQDLGDDPQAWIDRFAPR
jgi:hypothetical protein